MVTDHLDKNLYLLEEDLHLLEEDLHPLEDPHTRGGPHQGEIHLGRGGTLGGILQGGRNRQGGETHQGGKTRQGGGIGRNQGHLQGELIPLDIEGNMLDLGRGLPTQGITTDDRQGDSLS
jgi:hypothetical protein